MKREMSWEMLKALCLDFASDHSGEFDEVIAVVRGGLAPAAVMAKALRVPVGTYYPGNDSHDRFHPTSDSPYKRVLFVEDLIGAGRTLENIKAEMNIYVNTWSFLSVIIDYESKALLEPKNIYCGSVEKDWISFPWETPDNVVEGDRGLFREGTDQYGQRNLQEAE